MDFANIREIAAANGFDVVKASAANLVLEKDNCRVRWSPRGESGALTAEISLPYHPETLPFVLSSRTWSGSQVSGNSQHICLKWVLDQESHPMKVLNFVSNISTMIREGQIPSLLKPVPRGVPGESAPDREAVELLAERLSCSRTVLVDADYRTVLSHVAELPPDLYEVDPINLSTNSYSLTGNLDELSQLNGTIILVGLDVVNEETRNLLLRIFERQSLLKTYYGARFLLHTDGKKLGDVLIPSISLPSSHRPTRDLLTAEGLPSDLSTVSTIERLVEHGLTPGEALQSYQRQLAVAGDDSQHQTALRLDRPRRSLLAGGESYSQLRSRAASIFAEQMIGNRGIVEKLTDLLVSWYLTESGPLTLALVGPSGAGKNHTAEIIAKVTAAFFGLSRHNYISFNAGSMVNRHGLWSLVGVQSGLKGAEKPGILESLTRGGVLSIDEVDKTGYENDMQGFLVDLLEDGGYRNGHGAFRKLPKSVLILTMNAGSEAHQERFERIGFGSGDPESVRCAVRDHYAAAYRKNLLPALRGRIQEVFYFNLFSNEELAELACREIRRMQAAFEELGLAAALPAASPEELAGKLVAGIDLNLGAREVRNRVKSLKAELLKRAEGGWQELSPGEVEDSASVPRAVRRKSKPGRSGVTKTKGGRHAN